jgi:hypothetical protein
MDSTNAYRLARAGGGVAVRAEVLRASTAVNYKIVPAGTRDGGAARVANTLRRAWKAAEQRAGNSPGWLNPGNTISDIF